MLPTECNMPDLSWLQKRPAQGAFLIHQMIGAEKRFPEAMGSYRRNMVRLADKAVQDYMDARECVLAQIQEMQRTPEEMSQGRIIYITRAADRLEDCILTVGRLFRYFEKVRSDKSCFPLAVC
jgi:hypothetical protein